MSKDPTWTVVSWWAVPVPHGDHLSGDETGPLFLSLLDTPPPPPAEGAFLLSVKAYREGQPITYTPPEPSLTIRQAAALHNISKGAIQKAYHAGRITGHRDGAGTILLDRASVEAFVPNPRMRRTKKVQISP